MKYIDLLGQHLKSDDVIDFLESDDLDVIYSFDRSHENLPDEYWVASKAEGVQMRFNEDQILDVLFFYTAADEGFMPCDPDSIGVPTFDSLESARRYAGESALSFIEGETDFLGVYRKGIKMDFGSHLQHSEFRGERLHLITVSLTSSVPNVASSTG